MLRHHCRITMLAVALAAALPLTARGAAPARDAAGTTAHLHAQNGVGCADCHGKGKPAPVAADRCLSCHGPVDGLVAKTADVKPINPHQSPHWGTDMDCAVCHRQHEPTVNWCSYCHTIDVKVP